MKRSQEKPACILIVDDEPVSRAILGETLTTRGFHCLEAGDGEQALAIIERQP